MNMHLVDWGIIGLLLLSMIYAAYKTKKYTRSVADFLAANRCAGRYILGVSDSMAGVGAITIVAWFEGYYKAGFSLGWWFLFMTFVVLTVSLSGWVQYRYRQTRVMTLAQFFEIRYSRKFRVFAGLTAFISGILNFGIFPAVGARFFMYFCQLPQYHISIVGNYSIDLTYVTVMIILLAVALYFTFAGGQIAVIVTDFIQGTVCFLVISIILIILFMKFPWSDVFDSLSALPPGESMLNPFDTEKLGAFDKWYYLIWAFGQFWCWRAWQGNQAYYFCARNAHEARMGAVFGSWRQNILQMMVMIIPICVFVMMHHSDWTVSAQSANEVLTHIEDDTIRTQVTTSVGLSKLLAPGLMGAFCAVMIAAFISTHDTYLHSWGSIFIQDVVLPFRKTQLSSEEHIKWLRWSIFGVAAFVFIFSVFFGQFDFILMFFMLTGTIWMGGAGTVIVGGLYWKRGTTAGAYAALTIGILLFFIGFILQKIWPIYHDGNSCPFDSKWLWFTAMMLSIVVYVLFSLLGKRTVFDLDKMLHRGKYAVDEDITTVTDRSIPAWQRILGIGKDFTRNDKFFYLCITGWTIVWGVIFIIVTLYNMIYGVSTVFWAKFWHFYVWITLIVGVLTTIWFTWGGTVDLVKMFRRLATMARNDSDDGTVSENNKNE